MSTSDKNHDVALPGLVLSLFPGIGLLDRGFEDEGFCVVRGPDLLWGGDVRKFNPPSGRFDGVIGGPPCQAFSSLRHLVKATGGKLAPNLIPEYERVCSEASPHWFLMENVPAAPEPVVPGYLVRSILLNNRWCEADGTPGIGAEQNRVRRFSFGTREGLSLKPRVAVFEHARKTLAVMASGGGERSPLRSAEAASGSGGGFDSTLSRIPNAVLASSGGDRHKEGGIRKIPSSLLEPVKAVIAHPGRSFTLAHPDGDGGRRHNGGEMLAPVGTVTANGTTWDPDKKRPRSNRSDAYFREACRLQGVPEGFDLPPFTVEAKIKAVGNGVPYALARAIAGAVREAIS